MDLFNSGDHQKINLLPHGGVVKYYGYIMPKTEADKYADVLMQSIDWKNDEAVIFGKKIITKRKVAWYGDSEFNYTYSRTTKQALPWTTDLLKLKQIAERVTGQTYNSCLLNLYHDGNEGMAWHSDAEKDLKKDGAIASMSFGAERKFMFKHKETKETISVLLNHGSLLLMAEDTQTNWLHRLPPSTLVKAPRINLTFRSIENTGQNK